ncbi:hypothetical protein FDP41_005512 [Naegleria fowleri]|uniref:Uncharacterized protein n=1 Tax=Naegleria fowleri TaxID=5763 RepID=A0A6A5BMD6_NAEFO|nr:uncharacterized protein FDP41_005679 [Naegleria fowleri]XP_044560231.1 uncharacterized protein FDP41_005512 [Naegleria fowleri]KAF0975308.1 hypothetical protein FDP41_005679 [Naegleria fowleri]KAF0975518.1 hypothetical protein FDP41_005512 [Naegleria fowleri]
MVSRTSSNDNSSSPSNNTDKIPTKTEWVRSQPIDITKRLPNFDIDPCNVVSGTRRRKNLDYHVSNLTGMQVTVKRSSKNTLEKRSMSSSSKITKSRKMKK